MQTKQRSVILMATYIGDMIKMLRQSNNMSQDELGKRTPLFQRINQNKSQVRTSIYIILYVLYIIFIILQIHQSYDNLQDIYNRTYRNL